MEQAPDVTDTARFSFIKKENLPDGRVRVRFEIGRHCCLDRGSREFEIALSPDRSTVTLAESHNLPVRRGEGDHEWKETHDFCYDFSARLATFDCLRWIRDHLLPAAKSCVACGVATTYRSEERERDLRDLHQIGFLSDDESRGNTP